MILFSEKVVPTFTSSNLNILIVEDFQEIFFDVFEFEINGKKFIAEKVSSYKEAPVVNIPLVLEGKEFTAPFVLQTGKFEILFNKNNSTFVKDIVEEGLESQIEYVEDEVEDIILEKKEDILREIAQARLSAEKYVEKIKQQKIDEAAQFLDDKKRAIDKEIDDSKKDLLREFLSIVDKVKGEFFEFNEVEKEKLSSFIEGSIKLLSDELVDTILDKQLQAEQKFNDSINELATNILSGVLLKEIDSNNNKTVSDVKERFELMANNLKKIISLSENEIKKDVDSRLRELNDSIVNLEGVNIELNDLINKGDNRALSRIGNVKSQLENLIAESESTLLGKVSEAEEKIKTFYDDKISLVEEKVTDLTLENKQYFINLINESKQSLLSEIANIKVDVPNIIIEKSDGKKEVDLKGIKTELEKIIGTRFSNELQSLKRLIEMSSGGGSVAKQFASGGTMDGNLTVNGVISASEYKGLDLSDYLPISGGTITNSLNVLSGLSATRIYTSQLDVLSANINIIDIKQYELSGFSVRGNATIAGNVSASGEVTANIRVNTDHVRLYNAINYAQINPPPALSSNISFDLPYESGVIASNKTAVMLAGAQSISGAKTFIGQIELTNQQATTPTSALTRQLGDLRYGTISNILSAPVTSITTNFVSVVSITLPIGIYQIDGFMASSHASIAGCKIRLGTNTNIKVGLTDNYGRPTVAAFSWPIIDELYNNAHPYAIRSDTGGLEYRRTITGIIEVITNNTIISLDYAQSVATPANPSTARVRSHILARQVN